MMRRVISVVCFFMLHIIYIDYSSNVYANWFDSMVGSIQTNSPNAWEGQQRGYFTGGGFSYRAKTGRHPFFQITPPRINAGCGGIDSFWGGFSYLNPEYLVQMFQNIMSAAPAYAFKLALQELCDPCDNVMSSLAAMSNAINNMTLDECATSQALVNAGGDLIAGLIGKEQKTGEGKGSWISDFADTLTAGANKINQSIWEFQTYEYCGGFKNHDADKWNKCISEVNLIGSIWDKVLKKDSSVIDITFVNMARSLFGDVIVSKPKEASDNDTTISEITYYKPCDGMDARKIIKAMMGNITVDSVTLTGPTVDSSYGGSLNSTIINNSTMNGATSLKDDTKIYVYNPIMGKASDGSDITTSLNEACIEQDIPDSLKVYKKSLSAIKEISEKMTTNPQSDLSADTISVITQSALPVYQLINTFAYRTYQGSPMNPEEMVALVNMTSFGYIEFMMQQYVRKAEGILDEAYIHSVNRKKGIPGDSKPFDEAYYNMKKNISLFRQEMAKILAQLDAEYSKVIQQTDTFLSIRERYIERVKSKAGMAF